MQGYDIRPMCALVVVDVNGPIQVATHSTVGNLADRALVLEVTC